MRHPSRLPSTHRHNIQILVPIVIPRKRDLFAIWRKSRKCLLPTRTTQPHRRPSTLRHHPNVPRIHKGNLRPRHRRHLHQPRIRHPHLLRPQSPRHAPHQDHDHREKTRNSHPLTIPIPPTFTPKKFLYSLLAFSPFFPILHVLLSLAIGVSCESPENERLIGNPRKVYVHINDPNAGTHREIPSRF